MEALLDGAGIEAVANLAVKAEGQKVMVGNKVFVNEGLKEINPNHFYQPLVAHTLQGMVDFIKNNIDEECLEKWFIHIIDHNRIELVSAANAEGDKSREVAMIVKPHEILEGFPFGKFMDVELFKIKLASCFASEDTTAYEDLQYLHKYTGKLTVSDSQEYDDDGITQRTTVKKGLSGALNEVVSVKPIVSLAPFRTFREVEQPFSNFLFRTKTMDGEPCCALYEADGGSWVNKAMENIKAALMLELPNMMIVS
jgi:hypothetical protein